MARGRKAARSRSATASCLASWSTGSKRRPEEDTSDFSDQTIFRSIKVEEPIGSIDTVAIAGLLASSRELMACTDLPGLLDRVLDRLQPVLKPDRSAILLFDEATGELTTRAVRPAGEYTSVSDFASSTAVREAIRAREVLEVCDARLDSRLQGSASIARAGVRSAICVPLLGRTGPIGALYADQVWYAGRFSKEQVQYTAAFAAHAAAALETATLYDDRERHFRATLEAFARAIDARDRYTAGHSERVTAYTLVLARAAGIADTELEVIRRACMLHDIGKVGVPDCVLLKPGPLDPAERRLMEQHVVIGYDMLVPLPFLKESLPGIRGHHERWGGGGYPDGLAGADIHPHARLMTVADSYDAMTSARPYRNALPVEEAVRRLRANCARSVRARRHRGVRRRGSGIPDTSATRPPRRRKIVAAAGHCCPWPGARKCRLKSHRTQDESCLRQERRQRMSSPAGRRRFPR